MHAEGWHLHDDIDQAEVWLDRAERLAGAPEGLADPLEVEPGVHREVDDPVQVHVLAGVGEGTFNELLGEVPTKALEASRLSGAGMPVTELLVHAGLSASKGQARTDIQGGGASLNNVRVAEVQRAVTTADLLFGKHLLLRKGRRNYAVVTVQG